VAPEQQYRLMVDERADQYSLAALTYEMLTGQKPLGIVRPPSQVHSRGPAEVDAVLMRALREDPDERCPTIRDFGAAIDAALARPAPMRRRRVLALGGAGLAALAAGGAWWWWPRPFPGGEASEPAPPPAPASPQESAPPAVAASRGPRVIQNTLGMEMVLIPPGEFLMGSEDEASERPVHRVRITRPFRISQREVTVGDFRQFVKAASYRTQAERDGKGGRIYDYVGKVPIQDKAFIWRAPGYPDAPTDDYPVSQVSWEDAHAFCRWLSQVEGQPYRLPTEAEWEYACRSETTTPWSFGDDERLLKEYAWYTRTQAGESPHPWGKKAPNPHGLRDMHGNIAEWCQDWYGPYPEGLQVDPRGPETGERRVVRGGSWNSNPRQVRSSARRSELPRTTHYAIGFRVCLTVTGPDTF
jgi:formylglycine-generating enzyme required for sulfatase activity